MGIGSSSKRQRIAGVSSSTQRQWDAARADARARRLDLRRAEAPGARPARPFARTGASRHGDHGQGRTRRRGDHGAEGVRAVPRGERERAGAHIGRQRRVWRGARAPVVWRGRGGGDRPAVADGRAAREHAPRPPGGEAGRSGRSRRGRGVGRRQRWRSQAAHGPVGVEMAGAASGGGGATRRRRGRSSLPRSDADRGAGGLCGLMGLVIGGVGL
jgi:hypothetical protein